MKTKILIPKSIFLIFSLFGLFFFARTSYAATYYVKNGGNDSLDGLSDATAWANCPGMPNWTGSSTLHDGDTVYFDNQSSWTSNINPINIDVVGGTSGVITYDGKAWGKGSGTRAKLTAGHEAVGPNCGVVMIRQSNIVFRGFEIDGASIFDHGINIGQYAPGNVDNILIDDVYVHNVGTLLDNSSPTWPYGIIVSSSGGPQYKTSNVTIQNSEVYASARGGINLYAAWGYYGDKVHNVIVRNNYIHGGGLDYPNHNATAMDVANDIENATIEYNRMDNNGGGISIRVSPEQPQNIIAAPTNIIIRYNIISNSNGSGIQVYNQGLTQSADIYGNLFFGLGNIAGAALSFGAGIYSDGSTYSSTYNVYNNTIYMIAPGGNGVALVPFGSSYGYPTINFRNNIVYMGASASQAIYDRHHILGLSNHSNNLIYRPDSNPSVTSLSPASTLPSTAKVTISHSFWPNPQITYFTKTADGVDWTAFLAIADYVKFSGFSEGGFNNVWYRVIGISPNQIQTDLVAGPSSMVNTLAETATVTIDKWSLQDYINTNLSAWETVGTQNTNPNFTGGTLPTGFIPSANSFIPDTNYFAIASGDALDNGTPLGSPYDVGINGVIRPQGAGWDIGAYQHGESDTTPPLPPTGLTVQ